MVLSLSELLERIRPAGAPGVAVDGEQSPEQLAAAEIADLAELLRAAEAEADLTLSGAHRRAERIRDEADEQVRRIRDDLPSRVAAAHVAGAALPTRRRDAELSRISDDTTREIDRLDTQAVTRLPLIVESVMAHIWDALDIADEPDGER
jgi:cell division septum initiation protein DivIVA